MHDTPGLREEQRRLLDLMKEHIERESSLAPSERRMVIISSTPSLTGRLQHLQPEMQELAGKDATVSVVDEAGELVGADFGELEERVLAQLPELFPMRIYKSGPAMTIRDMDPWGMALDAITPEANRTMLKLKHSGFKHHTHPTSPGRKTKGKIQGWQW